MELSSPPPPPGTSRPLFLRAACGEDTPTAPVWIMRQAGRYLPEYRALKERYSFWQLSKEPELIAEVTLQPIRRFPLDAAIVFSDIMTPLESLGIRIDFTPGPVVASPLRSSSMIESLAVPEAEAISPYVSEGIKLLRSSLSVPLIGFAGAPLTLATYLIEGQGSKEYPVFRAFLRSQPEASHRLLSKLALLVTRFLRAQIEAGAQAIQLFDSWAGLLDAESYATFGAPYAASILEGLADLSVPRIYIALGSAHLLPQIAALPAEVISLDWRTPLAHARKLLPQKTLQGNLDPAVLLAPKESLAFEIERTLQSGLGGAHIFNLGHGIFPHTSPDHLAFLLDTVHAFPRHA